MAVMHSCEMGDMYWGGRAERVACENIRWMRLVFTSIAEYRHEKAKPMPDRLRAHVSVVGGETRPKLIKWQRSIPISST